MNLVLVVVVGCRKSRVPMQKAKMKNQNNLKENQAAAPAEAKNRPGINQCLGDRDLCSRRVRLPTENRPCLTEVDEGEAFCCCCASCAFTITPPAPELVAEARDEATCDV